MKTKIFLALAVLALTSCAQNPQQLREQNLPDDLIVTQNIVVHDVNRVGDSVSENGDTAAKKIFSQPMTLIATINYALEHNLDAAIEAQRIAVQQEKLSGATWRLLPSLLLSGEYARQNHYVPSSSMSWQSKNQSLEPSVSHDRNTRTFSAEASWNLLNLAVDYQRMQQAGKQLAISEYELRRIKQNLVLDVTNAWLNCAIARQAATQAAEIIGQAERRQRILEQESARAISNPVDVLRGEIALYQLQEKLRRYNIEAKQQWQQLAQLLGVPEETDFHFASIAVPEAVAALLNSSSDLESLEIEALRHRPEMFRLDLKEQEARHDANIALTRLFPNLTPFARYNHDENSYLSRDEWTNVGLRVSWDLFTLPRLLAEKKEGDERATLLRKQRQTQALAVVTQLNLAVQEYQDAREGLALARKIEQANGELEKIVSNNVATGRGGNETVLLTTRGDALQARVNTLQFWANLVLAKARIYNSLGRDFSSQDMDVSRGIMSLDDE